MTIDHDAIAARVRQDNTLGLNICAAYLDLYDEVKRLRAERDACAIYLKPDETPRERMDRDHKDVLGLMKLLEQKAIRAEKAEAERDALRAALERCPPTSNPTLSAEYHLERINAWWRLWVRPVLAKP